MKYPKHLNKNGFLPSCNQRQRLLFVPCLRVSFVFLSRFVSSSVRSIVQSRLIGRLLPEGRQ